MMMWMKLVWMTTIACSLRREPHEPKGNDRAKSKMAGMRRLTAPLPTGGGNKPFKPPGSLDLFQNRVNGATTAKQKPKAASKKT